MGKLRAWWFNFSLMRLLRIVGRIVKDATVPVIAALIWSLNAEGWGAAKFWSKLVEHFAYLMFLWSYFTRASQQQTTHERHHEMLDRVDALFLDREIALGRLRDEIKERREGPTEKMFFSLYELDMEVDDVVRRTSNPPDPYRHHRSENGGIRPLKELVAILDERKLLTAPAHRLLMELADVRAAMIADPSQRAQGYDRHQKLTAALHAAISVLEALPDHRPHENSDG